MPNSNVDTKFRTSITALAPRTDRFVAAGLEFMDALRRFVNGARSMATSLGVASILVVLSANVWATDPTQEKTLPEEPVAESQNLSTAESAWRDHGWPLLRQYCLDCHNKDVAEAELDLSGFENLAGLEINNGSMNRVLEMVRFGAMPPEDSDTPTEDERKQLVSAIEKTLYAVSCDLRPRPGKVTARRLNRTEYNNSIRDLFAMDLRPADAFPSDEVGGGFDNNGDVLSLSPMLVEKYLTAAEQVSQKVVIDPNSFPRIEDDRVGDRLVVVGENRVGSFFGRFLAPDSFVWAEFDVPSDGEYRIRVGGGAVASPDDEDAKDRDAKKEEKDKAAQDNEDQTDRKKLTEVSLGVFDQSGTLLGIADFNYYGGSGSSDNEELRVQLQQGKQRLMVAYLPEGSKAEVGKVCFRQMPELAEERVAEQRKQLEKTIKPDGRIDAEQFPFMVRRINVSGPSKAPDGWLPPSQKLIVRKTPQRRGKGYVEKEVIAAAIECLKPLMHRAFRQPVDISDIEPYANLVAQSVARDESYYRGLQIAVSAVLVSPRFLFRIETPGDLDLDQVEKPAEPKEGTEFDLDVPLNQLQLATRLSYFLWSSTPDEELLKVAGEGRLKGDEIDRQVRRMIADPKSLSLATEFAGQWFGLRNLDEFEADRDRFPGVNDELLELMQRETEHLFMHIVRENRPVPELISADYSFLNERLAKHYGVEKVQGEELRLVSLASTPRRGVLSHASVLTLTSNPTRTSPVKRGKWILENVLGTPPPDPPPGVPELEETKTASAEASLREQLELHRENAACASCHRVMDQLGFGLEQFDAVGRFRTLDGGQAIDASGELPGGRSFEGAAELSHVLAASEKDAFTKTAVQRLMTFALGRELTPQDQCTVDEIATRVNAQGALVQEVILEVVRSRPFQYYQWNGAASPQEAQHSEESST